MRHETPEYSRLFANEHWRRRLFPVFRLAATATQSKARGFCGRPNPEIEKPPQRHQMVRLSATGAPFFGAGALWRPQLSKHRFRTLCLNRRRRCRQVQQIPRLQHDRFSTPFAVAHISDRRGEAPKYPRLFVTVTWRARWFSSSRLATANQAKNARFLYLTQSRKRESTSTIPLKQRRCLKDCRN